MAKADSLQGSMDLLVLKILSRRPGLHGYAIMSAIQDISGTTTLSTTLGSIFSANVDGSADVVASALILSVAGSGSIGHSPLEIAVDSLDATTQGGKIEILDTTPGLTMRYRPVMGRGVAKSLISEQTPKPHL